MKTAILASLASASLVSAGLRPCTYREVALATGIHLNIQGQYAEYNGTLNIIKVETEQPGDFLAFQNAKGMLETDVQTGMNLRLFNQQIAPPGNPAIPGLAEYASDEETEKSQAAGLTGVYAEDEATLKKLLSEIKTGIALNEDNLKNATSQCDFTLKFPPADEMGS